MSLLLAVPNLESHSTRKISSGSWPSRWRPRYKSFEPSNTRLCDILFLSLVQGLWVIRCRPVRVFVFSFNIPSHGLPAHGQRRLSFFETKSSQQQAGLARNQSIIRIPNQTINRTIFADKFLILVIRLWRDWGFLFFFGTTTPKWPVELVLCEKRVRIASFWTSTRTWDTPACDPPAFARPRRSTQVDNPHRSPSHPYPLILTHPLTGYPWRLPLHAGTCLE